MGGGGRVFIGGLAYGTREKDLERFCRSCGRIRNIFLKGGYAFVEFDDYRDADDAVHDLNGKELLGEKIMVQHARPAPARGGRGGYSFGYGGSSSGGGGSGGGRYGKQPPIWLSKYGPPTRTEYKVIIENLSSRVSWQDLKDIMRKAGEVTYADAHRANKNEGIVEFSSYSDMKKAIDKYDGVEICGRKIHLIDASGGHGSRSRSRSPRRSYSRGRSDSRSRSRSRGRGRHSRSRSRSRDSRSNSREPKKTASRSRSRTPTPAKRSSEGLNGRDSRDRSAD